MAIVAGELLLDSQTDQYVVLITFNGKEIERMPVTSQEIGEEIVNNMLEEMKTYVKRKE